MAKDGWLEQLERLLPGKVARDASAATAHVWNALLHGEPSVLHPHRPAAVVCCSSSEDVVKAATLGVQHKLCLSAKGTGHQYGGAFLPEGGILLDMSGMTRATIDPKAQTATIEPGCTTQQVRQLTSPHGLHFTGGHISTVGCTGFTLGGGNGFGQRLWGAACDNLISAKVVTVWEEEPRLLSVTCDSHPELFYCLKGGGFFVALVVELVLALHAVPDRLPVQVAAFTGTAAVEAACQQWLAWLDAAPAAVESALELRQAPQPAAAGGQPQLMVLNTAFAQTPEVDDAYGGVRHLAASLGGRLLQDDAPPYEEALAGGDAGWLRKGICCYMHSANVEAAALPRLLPSLAAQAAAATHPWSGILVFRPTYKTASAAASFPGCFMVLAYALWEQQPQPTPDPQEPPCCSCCLPWQARVQPASSKPGDDAAAVHVAWANAVAALLHPHNRGSYVNECMHDAPGSVATCYSSENLGRLRAVKAQFDPHGLLRKLT